MYTWAHFDPRYMAFLQCLVNPYCTIVTQSLETEAPVPVPPCSMVSQQESRFGKPDFAHAACVVCRHTLHLGRKKHVILVIILKWLLMVIFLLQFSGILEKNGLPPIVAGLGVLIAALIALDTFNNVVLGEGVLNNPSNALAFAAAGKGSSLPAATVRIVSVPPRPSNLTYD